jgi:hypothetical protein
MEPESSYQLEREIRKRALRRLLRVGGGTLVVLAMLYAEFGRGKLLIEVDPANAVVQLDGEVLSGPMPRSVPVRVGRHQLVVSKEGYSTLTPEVRIGVRQTEVLRVRLEPSSETGFELTSEPPSQLVWLDGQPFTGANLGGPQARTDLRASRVPPGRHVLDIKGDARFAPWRHEFIQKPGLMVRIHAHLETASP